MRQLDSCDFCGDAPEGVFEVVPASVAGEAKRLALCADCRATLESVTEPLLAAAQSGGSPGDKPPESAGASNQEDASHELDATPSDAQDESGGSTSAERDADQSSASTNDESSDNVVTIGDAESGHRQRADSSTEQSDTEATEQRERKPEGYAQVVRLLQNRDGAMPRDDLRALATNAYDIGGRQFEDAVDAAVENGDVQETSDGLQTE